MSENLTGQVAAWQSANKSLDSEKRETNEKTCDDIRSLLAQIYKNSDSQNVKHDVERVIEEMRRLKKNL